MVRHHGQGTSTSRLSFPEPLIGCAAKMLLASTDLPTLASRPGNLKLPSREGAAAQARHYPPRRNGAPCQELLVIRRSHHTGEVSLGSLRWPYWCEDPKGGRLLCMR